MQPPHPAARSIGALKSLRNAFRRDDGAATSIAIIMLVIVMVATQLAGFVYTTRQQAEVIAIRDDARELRVVQQALSDAEDSVKDFALTGEAGYLQTYFVAIRVLAERTDTALAALDEVANPDAVLRGKRPARAALDTVRVNWRDAIRLTRAGDAAAARDLLVRGGAKPLLAEARGAMARYLDIRNAESARREAEALASARMFLALQLLGGGLALLGLVLAFRRNQNASAGRRRAISDATGAREQVERLFAMNDMLQSAVTQDDANAVLQATVDRLLPEFSGALYVFSNSRDRLDLSTSWRIDESERLAETIAPDSCWALKRGKPHVNGALPGTLRCAHHDASDALEVPMSARGEVYGLLTLRSGALDPEATFAAAMPVITAITDAMSLTLANIALREKLRNQALRDALTGLYNRRYMEDMLERHSHLAERSGRAFSVIMIDLDHFKRLNDEHGHAMGDAVLHAAAAAISSGLRQSDIACRYGGEELVVLMPECPLGDAMVKAEQMRARVEALSDAHGVRVTASFGVSSYPESAPKVGDLLLTADAALYEAKQSGRNCVAIATRRDSVASERGDEAAAN